jgi:hypothetical protein
MANEVHPPPEPTMTGLLRGIINDIGDLIRQEIRFAKTEAKADLLKSGTAFAFLAVAVGVTVLGGILLTLMLVHLLHWLTLPPEGAAMVDPAHIPLWGCYGIVAAVFLVSGAILAWLGVKKFQSFNPLPDETARTVKENVEWIVNSK